MAYKFKNGIPIYLQIIDELSISIASGKYAPGDKLPSVREFAVDIGVNPNTLQRAFSTMESMGIVHVDRTNGRYVTDDEKVLSELRAKLSKRYIEELVTRMRKLKMSDEEILNAIKRWLEEV
ncbi:GntR family transcriptional regulator [Alterileibacterium massiliense]|uniref:GntR family transcriptional regulator n=1 Tax=Alterileibacterium massiliense TaxID=1870997 RepID=UPI0008DA36A1|nr:GntR family transcriptional regulator [Alterileibacterium massiliense]